MMAPWMERAARAEDPEKRFWIEGTAMVDGCLRPMRDVLIQRPRAVQRRQKSAGCLAREAATEASPAGFEPAETGAERRIGFRSVLIGALLRTRGREILRLPLTFSPV